MRSFNSLNGKCRLGIFILTLLLQSCLFSQIIDPAKAQPDPDKNTLWYDATLLQIEGKGWNNTENFYERLPADVNTIVPDGVWLWSRCSSGLSINFNTNATFIKVRWTLKQKPFVMTHMALTGTSGVDLYIKTENQKWEFVATGRPYDMINTATFATGLNGKPHDFKLYLPLYDRVEKVEIAIPADSRIEKTQPTLKKPIVFYGTSTTQGACASRPGMSHTSIIGRKLDHPVINLGFDGNGKMHIELAEILAQINASMYVIECLPNMNVPEVNERAEPFVKKLRKACPDTPIVLVEHPYFHYYNESKDQFKNTNINAAQKRAYENLKKDGIKNLYLISDMNLYGTDGEASVDGIHCTDLGFLRQANVMEPILKKILKQNQ